MLLLQLVFLEARHKYSITTTTTTTTPQSSLAHYWYHSQLPPTHHALEVVVRLDGGGAQLKGDPLIALTLALLQQLLLLPSKLSADIDRLVN